MRHSLVPVALLVLAPAAFGQHAPPAHGHDDATMRHPFDDVEKWTAVFDDPARSAWQKPAEVARARGLAAGRVVLDLGAGTGYFNKFFAEAVRPGGRVYAADVEPKLVEWMLKRAVEEGTPEVFPLLVPADAPRVPEKVDVVFVCDTWHHIDDRIAYVQKIGEILEPGGALVVVDFRKGNIPVGPPEEHRLAPEKVIEEVEAGGLKLVRREELLPYQYMLVFRARQVAGVD